MQSYRYAPSSRHLHRPHSQGREAGRFAGQTLVGEHTTIINRVKGTLARLGIRSLNPKLKKAPERVEHLRAPEGEPIPPNTLAELQRDLARKQLVRLGYAAFPG